MDGQVKNSASSDPQDRQQEHNTTKMSDYTLPKLAVSDHGLRDSASCVNSDWACQWKMAKFNTAQGPHPLTDYQKMCHRWLCRQALRPCQIWCKCVKYNQFFLFVPFLGISQQVRPINGFSCLMAKTMWTCVRRTFWGFHQYYSPFRGWNPNPPILGVWIDIFKPNVQNI